MDITEQLRNPASEIVIEALSRSCDQCLAPPGDLCTKRGGIRQDLLGRVIHIGRIGDH